MNEIEYSVEERNEYGQPSVIEKRFAQPSSYLRDQYLRKMPKKQRNEQFLLKQRDQARLMQLFELPDLLEDARKQRIEQGKALEEALTQVSRLPEEPEEKELESPSPKQGGGILTTVSWPQQATQLPVKTILKQDGSDTELWAWVSLTVFFFVMAYSCDAREFVKRKVIVELIIDTIVPPLFDMACNIGQSCLKTAPVASKTIVMLYYCWKVWVSVGAVVYLYCKTQEMCTASTKSVDTLWRRAREYVRQGLAK